LRFVKQKEKLTLNEMRRFFQERKRKKEVEGNSIFNENHITMRNMLKRVAGIKPEIRSEHNFDFLSNKNTFDGTKTQTRFVRNT
jgi:hypothetical protein